MSGQNVLGRGEKVQGDIDWTVPAGREKPLLQRAGVRILGVGVVTLGLYAAFQAAKLPECSIDGDAGVTLAGNDLPSGYLGDNLHWSEDGSQVAYGHNSIQPFCNVVTPAVNDDFSQSVIHMHNDEARVAIRHPDGSLDILIKSTGAYDETIGELHDHGSTATYLITDQSGAETMFSADVEPGTDWKPLSELRPARTPGYELGANDI